MNTSDSIQSFTIQKLFETKSNYVIPVYQRNYAWGLGELSQLVHDIKDYVEKDTPYYIGTLVVAEQNPDNETYYETIDGQQRLTTLTILLNALHRYYYDIISTPIKLNLCLKFHSRPKSTDTLEAIGFKLNEPVNFLNSKEQNINIKERYIDAENLLEQLFKETKDGLAFYKYLTTKVMLVRVSVPKETDLNHYFEVMNNRGEQLEKHEVLKSTLLSYFQDDIRARNGFNKIWEAVSDMERYVQYGFTTKERDCLFGNDDIEGHRWNTFEAKSFDEILIKLEETKPVEDKDKPTSIEAKSFDEILIKLEETKPIEDKDKPTSIFEIVKFGGAFAENKNEKEDAPERFNSVINFPSFLLHILKIQKQKDIPLDDKKLISSFKDEIDSREKVELFIFYLLKGKHLFDQYVIKREFKGDNDNWSLKRLKWYFSGNQNRVGYVNTYGDQSDPEQNRNILMLLSMFHVSLPSMNYKHWLSASLNYLFNQESIQAVDYSHYLYEVAQSYFYDRILNETELDYYEMIFEKKYQSRTVTIENLKCEHLDKGTSVENFAFNFVDYLLWIEKDKPDFEYTFRSSVEHYYPQNPINGVDLGDDILLNSFGNLCLISSSKNSKLSNNMPLAKKGQYDPLKRPDSLKQKEMMDETSDKVPWDKASIIGHKNNMKSLIEKYYSNAN